MIITAFSLHVNRRHHSREGHIITLQDPLEYMHRHDKCIVSQREICTDTESYLVSLRATLRQSPDVILLGEMRDYETYTTVTVWAVFTRLCQSSAVLTDLLCRQIADERFSFLYPFYSSRNPSGRISAIV